MDLEQTLKLASNKVWQELEPVPRSSNVKIFEVREEALTTMALKEIYKAACPNIERIEMVSAIFEATSGYDFEVAIGSKRKGKFVRLFFQSKTLKGKDVKASYKEIDFDQTDNLISYAKKHTSLPMYAFYNHLMENDIRLHDYYNSASLFDKKNMGITIAAAYSVYRLKSKKFVKFHYNFGRRINPALYSLRFYPHLFYFHDQSNSHLAVPFHELAFFTIDIAERINRMYQRIKSQGRLNLLLLLMGLEEFDDSKKLIPILKTSPDELVEDFQLRQTQNEKSPFNPLALIIINTDINIS
jgi:hypothetical protein